MPRFYVGKLLLHHYMSDLAHTSDRCSSVIELHLSCLGFNGITREFHPTSQVYVGTGIVGHFLLDYLDVNGRRIPILGKISINGSVELLGILNFHRTSGPMFTENLLAPHDTTCWGDGVTSNKNWTFS